MRSICSLSSLLHIYWLFINMLGVTIFATHFNTWINRFSRSQEEGEDAGVTYMALVVMVMVIMMVVLMQRDEVE